MPFAIAASFAFAEREHERVVRICFHNLFEARNEEQKDKSMETVRSMQTNK